MSTLDKVLKNKIIDDIQEIKEDINILNEGLEEVNEEVDVEDTPAKSNILYMKEDGDSIPEGIKLIDWNKEDGIFKVIKLSNPNATYHLHQTHIKEDNITTYSQFLFGDGNVRKRTGVVEESNCPKFNPQPEWGEWESLIEDEEPVIPEEPITPEIYSDYKNGDLVLCKEFTSNPEHEIRPYTDFESMSVDDKNRIIGVIVDVDEKIFVKCKWDSKSWVYSTKSVLIRNCSTFDYYARRNLGAFYCKERDYINSFLLMLPDKDNLLNNDVRLNDKNEFAQKYGVQYISYNNFLPTTEDLFKCLYITTDYNNLTPIDIMIKISNLPEDSLQNDVVFNNYNYTAGFLSCNHLYSPDYYVDNFFMICNEEGKKFSNKKIEDIIDEHVIVFRKGSGVYPSSSLNTYFQIFDKLNIK